MEQFIRVCFIIFNYIFFCYIADGTVVARVPTATEPICSKKTSNIKIPKPTTIVGFGIINFISNVSSTIRS
ncbi:hypothetical protein SAMN05216469_1207 [Ruminococcus albus]|uniref:Uncharacterized protein n=1 Tax=Ruminococcus albus TaxID=1264 RepID=A0A1H7P9C1_RUMAL|nr:hypothetical protein SAMN05216469_1207 [Ruminococcus albus]